MLVPIGQSYRPPACLTLLQCSKLLFGVTLPVISHSGMCPLKCDACQTLPVLHLSYIHRYTTVKSILAGVLMLGDLQLFLVCINLHSVIVNKYIHCLRILNLIVILLLYIHMYICICIGKMKQPIPSLHKDRSTVEHALCYLAIVNLYTPNVS